MSTDQIYLGNPRLKKANVKLDYTKEQVEELAKCANDILYFCNMVKQYFFKYSFINNPKMKGSLR